ncbi:MAG: hypothetical protein ABIJ43_04140 [Candidatus Beckwithbacteria bacterium]|uniref:Uncharacterized protein n=1 Tax=viral metagenome TaxID=1070528 RepID=A0A6H2A4P8_9ZZZZ
MKKLKGKLILQVLSVLAFIVGIIIIGKVSILLLLGLFLYRWSCALDKQIKKYYK